MSTGPRQAAGLTCPACGVSMQPQSVDVLHMDAYRGWDLRTPACGSCGGTWLERSTLARVIEAARKGEAEFEGPPRHVARRTLEMPETIVYRSCPVCAERTRRRNFGLYSGIVVHECERGCGTYFDQGDLDAVLAFVRTGGLRLNEPPAPPRRAHPRPPTPSDVPRSGNMIRARVRGPSGMLSFVLAFTRWFVEGLGRGLVRGLEALRALRARRTSRRARR